jgi:hypothetical protein
MTQAGTPDIAHDGTPSAHDVTLPEAVTPDGGTLRHRFVALGAALVRSPRSLAAAAASHHAFTIVLVAGALLRACASLGYRPAMYDNDSFEYIGLSLRLSPYEVRPVVYSAFLRALLPFHSLALVVILQHLMGLAIAIMLYALMRRWRVPAWLATLASVPQLLDWHIIELEQMIFADTLFILVMMAAIVIVAWRAKASWQMAAVAGLLLALASLTRTVGEPILVLALVYFIVRRAGWRPVVVFVSLAAIPLTLYAGWFDDKHGRFELTSSDGIFLYSRVMLFADCAKIKPPADLAVLCDSRPPGSRGQSSDFIWQPSPLDRLPGGNTLAGADRFSNLRNEAARRFALRAIVAQPGDYLRISWTDFTKAFTWVRDPHRNAGEYIPYHFTNTPKQPTWDRVFVPGGTAMTDSESYNHGFAATRVVRPYARFMQDYQHVGYIPGAGFGVVMLVGLAGILAWWRRDERRWVAIWLWATMMGIIGIAPLTAQFAYRYVLPGLPLAFAAAAVAISIVLRLGTESAPEPLAGSRSDLPSTDTAPDWPWG